MLFDALEDLAPSWCKKGPMPKGSRWFSWHEAAEVALPEFYLSRMLLEWYFPEEPNPEATSHLELRTGDLGGLRLMLRCLTRSVFELCHILLKVGRPCWTWYTFQIAEIKTSTSNLHYNIRMALEWQSDQHLKDIASILACNDATFEFLLETSPDPQGLASTISDYTVTLLGKRAGSLSKHGAPPYCYAGILAEWDDDIQEAALSLLKTDFQTLLQLETSTVSGAQDLVEDLHLSFGTVTRLVCHHFERSGWRFNGSVEASRILHLLFAGIADNKIIEDIHKDVRKKQKSSAANQQMTVSRVQRIVNQSRVLDERQWAHPAKVDKDAFTHNFRGTKRFANRVHSNPKTNKLPKNFSRILSKRKSWKSLSESNLIASAAGWAWIREYKQMSLSQQKVRLKDLDCLEKIIIL